MVNCVKNSTTTVLERDGFSFFSTRTALRYRTDDQATRIAAGVSVSLDHRHVGWWNGGGISFIKSLYGAKTLKIETVDGLDGDTSVFLFDVESTKPSLAGVAKACNWGN